MKGFEMFGMLLSYDALLQTIGTIIGSFFGAFIAGKLAVNAVVKQIKNENQNRIVDRSERFYKVCNELNNYLGKISFCLESLNKEICSGVFDSTKNAKLQELIEYLSTETEKLSLIPKQDFIIEVYPTYNIILSSLYEIQTAAYKLLFFENEEEKREKIELIIRKKEDIENGQELLDILLKEHIDIIQGRS